MYAVCLILCPDDPLLPGAPLPLAALLALPALVAGVAPLVARPHAAGEHRHGDGGDARVLRALAAVSSLPAVIHDVDLGMTCVTWLLATVLTLSAIGSNYLATALL